MKICFKCKVKKCLRDFYKHPQMPDGRVNKCKECNKKDVRDNIKKRKEFYAEYDRDRIRNNFNYIFLHRYSGMLARTEGRISRERPYRVTGKSIMTKKEFIHWCYQKRNMKIFQKLHKKWKENNFERNLCPSIDRIDNEKGYVLGNIQWITVVNNVKKYYNKSFV
jgi:hypothetical protein